MKIGRLEVRVVPAGSEGCATSTSGIIDTPYVLGMLDGYKRVSKGMLEQLASVQTLENKVI